MWFPSRCVGLQTSHGCMSQTSLVPMWSLSFPEDCSQMKKSRLVKKKNKKTKTPFSAIVEGTVQSVWPARLITYWWWSTGTYFTIDTFSVRKNPLECACISESVLSWGRNQSLSLSCVCILGTSPHSIPGNYLKPSVPTHQDISHFLLFCLPSSSGPCLWL